MIAFILFCCVVAGILIYFGIVRPLCVPLTQRIPTGRAYRPTFGAKL